MQDLMEDRLSVAHPDWTAQIDAKNKGRGLSTEHHPVWTVYDKLRTARLNVKYYSRRLQAFERVNFVIELVLLATAPSSAIAALWFWKLEVGKPVWQALGIIAAFAAVLKPLLGLTKRIKEFESVLSGYRVLDFDLMDIKAMVEQRGKYDSSLQSDFRRALQRERILVGKTPEARENVGVKRRCQDEVNRELPAECFYVPED
jgi:hypothetical protein